ncbi:DUF4879 domain-containing protein [Acetonema longum]|uniref:DUF5626 domain-containing protein n=1 Tax=Acetonema longum DSM 6540 TaxID=1009370 RepID=F7NQ95_9FIRM|nr:DUF4879 domain-containing protein [Acetonema longum]EGO61854.1 hypothetical protein ALO_21479 [Acetonema longum DSM 6540]
MKKSIVFLLLVFMVMVSVSPLATAGPAPALTKVDIAAFTAENYSNQWQKTPTSYPKSMSGYSFSGPVLYMAVVYTGYPNWNLTFIKINGNQFRHSEIPSERVNLVSGGVIVGYEVHYKIPKAQLSSSNTISVNSSGTNGGSGSSVSTNIKFVK